MYRYNNKFYHRFPSSEWFSRFHIFSEWIQSKAIPVVFGKNNPVIPPEIIKEATRIRGMAQLTSKNIPNVSCARMAPRRPNANVTAIPVDRDHAMFSSNKV